MIDSILYRLISVKSLFLRKFCVVKGTSLHQILLRVTHLIRCSTFGTYSRQHICSLFQLYNLWDAGQGAGFKFTMPGIIFEIYT